MLESGNGPKGSQSRDSQRRRSPRRAAAQEPPQPEIQATPRKPPAKRKSRSKRGAPQPLPTLPPIQAEPEVLQRPRRKRFSLLDLIPRRKPRPGSPRPDLRGPDLRGTSNLRPDPLRRTRQPSQPKPPSRPASPLVYATRLLIVGVGVGVFAGTSLSIWNPSTRPPSSAQAAQSGPPQIMAANALTGGLNTGHIAKNTLGSGQEIPGLIAKIAPLTQGLTDLEPGVFMVDLDKGNYYSFNGDKVFASASTIKVPVLIAFFQDVDAGKIRLDEVMTMEAGDVADNSGDMQFSPVGSQYSALEVASKMIVVSDNTATNMMIRRLGGMEKLNQRFKQWGLQQTVLRDRLPDLAGTNTVTPKDLTTLLTAVSQGQLISMASRDRALAIMRLTETDTLLPAAIGPGATISHKTGDIKSVVGDSGLIDMPSGKRYVITILVKRPDNDERAQELIRQIAGTIYDHLNPIAPQAPESAAESTAEPSGAPAADPLSAPELDVPVEGSPESAPVP